MQRALVVAGARRQMAHEPLIVAGPMRSLARGFHDRMRRPRPAFDGAGWKWSLTFNGRFKLSRSQEVLGLARLGSGARRRLTGAASLLAIRYLLLLLAGGPVFAFGKENNAFGNE